jgi:hypothetical protein
MIFKFAGGPFDGREVVGQPGRDDDAQRYYWLTNHAQIGQRFRTASDYAIELLSREELKEQQPHHFQQHVYEVVDRIQGDDALTVLIHYVDHANQR